MLLSVSSTPTLAGVLGVAYAIVHLTFLGITEYLNERGRGMKIGITDYLDGLQREGRGLNKYYAVIMCAKKLIVLNFHDYNNTINDRCPTEPRRREGGKKLHTSYASPTSVNLWEAALSPLFRSG
jgi:hypothetical protein